MDPPDARRPAGGPRRVDLFLGRRQAGPGEYTLQLILCSDQGRRAIKAWQIVLQVLTPTPTITQTATP